MNGTSAHQHMYELCMKHMHQYVRVQMNDGRTVDGIIADVDEWNVTLDVPAGTTRNGCCGKGEIGSYSGLGGFGYGFYGPWPGYYPGYGFRRIILPLAALTALATLPYFWY